MARPIGNWLKEIDRLIEESFGRVLAEQDLTRRHWQVLNTIAEGPLRAGADVELTAAGRAAHAVVSERVMPNRRALTEGITAEEYANVVNLLERMATNLRTAGTGS